MILELVAYRKTEPCRNGRRERLRPLHGTYKNNPFSPCNEATRCGGEGSVCSREPGEGAVQMSALLSKAQTALAI